jgi:hypothetical protein
MGTVEILPDLTVVDTGSRTIVGGAGSVLASINDASDATYVQAAGTIAGSWDAYFRMAAPVGIPAGAAIRSVQVKMRHSHPTYIVGTGAEFMQPIAVLVGRTSGGKHVYDAYDTAGAALHLLGTGSSATDVTLPRRSKDWSGKYYLGERAQVLANRRFYVSVSVTRGPTALNLVRLYRLSLLVHYDERPVVDLINPAGVEVVARPPFDWTFTDAEGYIQRAFDVRIYTLAMATAAGFNIEDTAAWPPVYRRQGNSPLTHHDLVSGFGQNGESYRAFVRASHADVWNPGYIQAYVLSGAPPFSPLAVWDSSDFSLAIAAPRPPTVTAVYNSAKHGIEISVDGLDNMLGYNDSTFEDGVGAWLAGNANTTLAQTSAQAFHGNDSLQLTRTATTGDAVANGPAVEVMAGEVYSITAMFRTAVTSRTVKMSGVWFSASGGLLGVTSDSVDTQDVTTGWRMAVAWGTAPANAAFLVPVATVVGAVASEVHYLDAVGVFPGMHTNYLTENQATIEVNTTGWAAGASSVIARTLVEKHQGLASLSLTRSGTTGTASANTPTGTSGIKVNASTAYGAGFYLKSSVSRTARVVIDWYTAAGALISSSNGSSVASTTTGWTLYSVFATSPGTAAFATVKVEVLTSVAVGELHFVDSIGFWAGTTVQTFFPWAQGGFLSDDPAQHVIILERYLELDEYGMPMWEVVPEPRVVHDPRHQSLDYVDYEVPALATGTYRAMIEALNQDGDPINSGWSVETSEDMVAFDSWWLRDPLDAGNLTMKIRVNKATITVPKPNTTDYPVGSDSGVMTHDGVKEPVINCEIQLLDEAQYEMFRAMVDSGATLLLQDVLGRQWYVQPDDGTEYDILRAAKTPLESWPVRHAHKVSIDFVSVERPRALATASTHG